ncbi:peptide ABC transporter substrate-binding protein [Sporolactobacillus laevolacticus]|uniref:Peptide ABC transporter substrate-binding protein n=1 Tax=Sporolactobacillus laevolacticus DSM 442 TaxID=1395513 RepID=V6IZI0_9BACL|nr:peptide ABC transporter substrate-binding protein [Sporolactobacillus laevolacticus]EST12922.1 peptide ABC transporter substrate-binding protein [Sporolactobacillus laevolacticus DSM 442]
MKKAKWSLVLSIVLALSLVLSACGSSTKSGSSKGGASDLAKNQVLNFATSADIPSIDVTQATDATSIQTISNYLSGLTRMHDGKTEWDLATGAPKVSADKKVITFKLRDQKWSNGKAVTAQDFVYGWQRQVDPKAKPQYNYLLAAADIKNAAKIEDPTNKKLYGKYKELGVKALDSKTLQVTLESPIQPFFYSLLSDWVFMPQQQAYVEKLGSKFATSASTVLYNGPWSLANWKKGQSWTFKKNPKYWNAKRIKLNELTYTVSKDLATSVNMYKTGKIDVVGLAQEQVASMKASNPKEVKTSPNSGMFFLYVNNKRKTTGNVDFRKALSAAIDRQGLVDGILKDGSTASNSIVPKGFVTGPDGKDFRASTPDGYPAGAVKDAKAFWAKAQKALGTKKVALELISSDSATTQQIDEYVANQIQKNLKGVTVKINAQPWANYLKLNNAGKYDLSYSGWLPDYQDPMTYIDMWATGNSSNSAFYSNKAYDKLVADAKSTTDATKRWTDMQDAEKIMLQQDQGIVPLYQSGNTWAQKPYVHNFYLPSYGPEQDYLDTYISKH